MLSGESLDVLLGASLDVLLALLVGPLVGSPVGPLEVSLVLLGASLGVSLPSWRFQANHFLSMTISLLPSVALAPDVAEVTAEVEVAASRRRRQSSNGLPCSLTRRQPSVSFQAPCTEEQHECSLFRSRGRGRSGEYHTLRERQTA